MKVRVDLSELDSDRGCLYANRDAPEMYLHQIVEAVDDKTDIPMNLIIVAKFKVEPGIGYWAYRLKRVPQTIKTCCG